MRETKKGTKEKKIWKNTCYIESKKSCKLSAGLLAAKQAKWRKVREIVRQEIAIMHATKKKEEQESKQQIAIMCASKKAMKPKSEWQEYL